MPPPSRWIAALALACASIVRADDIGVADGVLVVRERVTDSAITYIANDPAVAIGPAEAAEHLSLRFELRFGREGAAAAVVAPAAQTGRWRTNRAGHTKYSSATARGRRTLARLVAIEPGETLKLFAESSAVSLDLPLQELPDGPVFAAACVVNGTQQFCHCTEFPRCQRQTMADAAGTVLSCRGGRPDASCAARRARCLGSTDCVLGDWNGDGTQVVVCGGDSNTIEFDKPRWCQRLGGLLDGVTTVPIAWPGTRASNDPGKPRLPLAARVYLESLLAKLPNQPDVIVLTWGTNDVPSHTPEEIVSAIDDLVRWMHNKGVVSLVATIPRRFDRRADYDAKITQVNARLAARYGRCLVDFTTITPPGRTWYNDDRHLNQAAHMRRAIAVYEALRAAPRMCGTDGP